MSDQYSQNDGIVISGNPGQINVGAMSAGAGAAAISYGRVDPGAPPVVPTTPEPSGPAESVPNPLRMGFSLDVIGYSRRSAPAQREVQLRLAGLVAEVLRGLGRGISEAQTEGTGDGLHVFLPPDIELQRALRHLLHETAARLAVDNHRHDDRIRLRMSVVIGPVGSAPLGFDGKAVVALSRLLDSPPLRQAATEHPYVDLVALVSDELYQHVVAGGYPGLSGSEFRRQNIAVKEHQSIAWLWIPYGHGSASG